MVSSCKLVYGDDIRKVSLENLQVASLYDKIRSLYSNLESAALDDLYLYYVDDENDKIRIKFDLELSEAMRLSSSSGRVLKIFIICLTEQSNPPPMMDANASETIINLLASLSILQASNSVINNAPYGTTPFVNVNTSNFIPPSNAVPFEPYVTSYCDFTQNPASPTMCDSSVYTSPLVSSVATNTLIDARDVGTEMPLQSVTQTTQTQQYLPTNQTTQTNYNITSATQTTRPQTTTTQTTTTAASTTSTSTSTHAYAGTQSDVIVSHKIDSSVNCEPVYYEPAKVYESTSCQVTHVGEITKGGDYEEGKAQGTGTQPSFYDCLIGTQFGNLLDKLHELGFNDKEKCAQALVKYSGKLHEAIDELLLDQLLA